MARHHGSALEALVVTFHSLPESSSVNSNFSVWISGKPLQSHIPSAVISVFWEASPLAALLPLFLLWFEIATAFNASKVEEQQRRTLG